MSTLTRPPRAAPGPAPALPVVVVADPGLTRFGMEAMVACTPGMRSAGATAAADDPTSTWDGVPPAAVVLDLEAGAGAGVALLVGLGCPPDRVPVLAVARARRWDVIAAAVDAGVAGLLMENRASPATFEEALATVATGGRWMDPSVAGAFLAARNRAQPLQRLSARQREVLRLVAEGCSNGVIAQRLHIAEPTVKTHLTQIYRVIGVENRTQAALWARSVGRDAAVA